MATTISIISVSVSIFFFILWWADKGEVRKWYDRWREALDSFHKECAKAEESKGFMFAQAKAIDDMKKSLDSERVKYQTLDAAYKMQRTADHEISEMNRKLADENKLIRESREEVQSANENFAAAHQMMIGENEALLSENSQLKALVASLRNGTQPKAKGFAKGKAVHRGERVKRKKA